MVFYSGRVIIMPFKSIKNWPKLEVAFFVSRRHSEPRRWKGVASKGLLRVSTKNVWSGGCIVCLLFQVSVRGSGIESPRLRGHHCV